MSFILDALKKAEQERARGLPPGLHAHVPLAPNRRLGLLVGLSLVAAGVIWSVFFRETATETVATANQLPAGVAAQGVDTGANTGEVNVPIDTLSTPPAPAELPNVAPLGADIDKVATVSAYQPPIALPTLATPITGASAPQLAQNGVPQMPIAEPSQQPVLIVQPAAEPPTPTVVSQIPTPEASYPAASVPAAPALPQIFELDYSVRNELPKMLLSMHVYNRDPQRRFVVINGKRLVEGEQIEGKVTIAAIVPTGIECEMNGTRFLFPRQTL